MGKFLEDAKNRRSVRTFNEKPIDKDVLDELITFSQNITNPYHLPLTFGFFDAKENDLSSPVLLGVPTYVTAKIQAGKNSDVAYGYSFQKLLMKAHSLGLGTVWIGGTMPREKFEACANLSNNEIMPCISPLG